MFGTYILLSTFLLSGAIPRWAGAIFVTLLALYLIAIYLVPKRRAFQEIEAEEEMGKPLKNIYLDLFFIGGGIASLAFGSQEIVAGAIHIAKFLGVDEASVSLSIVSVGTTLPELSCCLVALRQKKYDILVGNIIGSNIFNVLSVLGIAALVRPLEVDQIRWVDLLMMFLSAALIFPVFQKEAGFGRIKGGVLLVIYAGYLYSLTFSIWQF
jgi:cation:H+ antiporter